MKTTSLLSLVVGSFVLLGCANSGHYPITGNSVGINDQVKFMSAPEFVRY
ncbi:hypothetical protein [Pyruvatibacter sp.]